MEGKKNTDKKNKLEPKNDKKKPKKESKEEVEKKLEEAISELEEKLGIDRTNFKIVKIDTSIKKVLKDSLLFTILNIILIMSISGFLKWANTNSILDILYFALIFSAFESLINYIITRFMSSLIPKSFGFILYLPPIIALLATTLSASFIEIISVFKLLLMFGILMFVRISLKTRLIRRKK